VPPVLYRVEEAAEALRLSRTAIYKLVRSGRLRTVKAGSRRLVPVVALAEYVASLGGVKVSLTWVGDTGFEPVTSSV
jgi:excisionase family DNA binding protein